MFRSKSLDLYQVFVPHEIGYEFIDFLGHFSLAHVVNCNEELTTV